MHNLIKGVAPDERAGRALAAIEQVGLKGWDRHYPSQLSGGMQQRAPASPRRLRSTRCC